MIDKTKQDISTRSHYFLLWGWGAFLGFVGQFILIRMNYQQHYQVWFVTVICMIVMIYWLNRDNKKEQVRTYVGDAMGNLWIGIAISFAVLFVIFMKIGFQYCYPFYILFYGLGTFISGRILKFTPLIIGGILNFLLAAGSVWFAYDYQMLFGAVAIHTGTYVESQIW
jgi:hypothetical protein